MRGGLEVGSAAPLADVDELEFGVGVDGVMQFGGNESVGRTHQARAVLPLGDEGVDLIGGDVEDVDEGDRWVIGAGSGHKRLLVCLRRWRSG